MDRALSRNGGSEVTQQKHQSTRPSNSSNNTNPFSVLTVWASKSARSLYYRAKVSNAGSKRHQFGGMIMYNSAYCSSPYFLEAKMEGLNKKSEGIENKKEGCGENHCGQVEAFVDTIEEEYEESSFSSDFLASKVIGNEVHSSSKDSSSPPLTGWTLSRNERPDHAISYPSQGLQKAHLDSRKLEQQGLSISETEMMKERFAKLLLGEDMSGCGNGVCTALVISNAITNLCATLFGQIWRLEPLSREKKRMWRREMEWLVSISDHIVELTPSLQTFPDGSKLEVMTCRPRSDLYLNLPALRKLDNMLLEILDSFENVEFWYVKQGIQAPESDGSASFQKPFPRQEEKWWLPVPRVPNGGLSEDARRHLQHKRDSTNQILKAAVAINGITLADMEIPASYLEALPKNGKGCLGDVIYRFISSDQYTPECLLDCLVLSSEHQALEIANKVESSAHVFRRKTNCKPINGTNRSNSKSSWEIVKDLVVDVDKKEMLAERAESLLLCLKQRFPGLPQTTLDMSKIQYNKDVGKSILESYSRVLESLAFNIVARIDDLLYVDDLVKNSDQVLPISKVGMVSHKGVRPNSDQPTSKTPYKKAYSTPIFSPSQRISPAKVDNPPVLDNKNPYGQRVLTNHSNNETQGKEYDNQIER